LLETPFSISVTTASDGHFQATGIPSGDYTICASGVRQDHLDTCEFGQPILRLTAGTAGSPANATLNIRNGSTLNIHIHDSAGRLASAAAASGVRLLVGVATDTGFYKRATVVNITANSADYTIAIPASGTVKLLID